MNLMVVFWSVRLGPLSLKLNFLFSIAHPLMLGR